MIDIIDRKLISILQVNLPLEENPYQALALDLDISEDEVLARLKRLEASGKLKRIQAILKHQRSGYIQNALVVFQVSEGITDILGQELAASSLVSHCYAREPDQDWPYNLYAMMHSKLEQEIENYVQILINKHQISNYQILYSEQELKKTSMVYY